MTIEEKKDYIVRSTKYIAFTIYGVKKDALKFVGAFDKLKARYFLDHGVKLSDRNGDTLFEQLEDDEIDNMVVSVNNLLDLYELRN